MQASLEQRVLRTAERHGMFRPGDRVGVGVSGGADSVALLRLLEELRLALGVHITVLHFNHQLRGAESDADEQFVVALAAERGFECVAERGDVAARARLERWNLEDGARRLRYAFFRSAVERLGLTRVAVAHNASDQAETVLARLVRGTGPAGLAAIYPVRGHVVRPLLEIEGGELREYLERIGQPWREDRSNWDTQRLRARLRHQTLPGLESTVGTALTQNLCRLAQLAREDEAFWAWLVRERLGALVQREDGRLGIRAGDLLAPLPTALDTAGAAGTEAGGAAQLALARRVVRGILEDLKGDCNQLTAKHVEQVLHLATGASSGHRTELPGAIVERSFEWIWFEAATKRARQTRTVLSEKMSAKNEGFERPVELGGAGETTVIAVPEIRRRFRLKVIDWAGAQRETKLSVLDRDLLHSPMVIRGWLPGDSFQPQGRRHVLKLKQLLREKRVAVRDRSFWPVLTSAGTLAWTRGCDVAAEFGVRKSTRSGVLIAEEEL